MKTRWIARLASSARLDFGVVDLVKDPACARDLSQDPLLLYSKIPAHARQRGTARARSSRERKVENIGVCI